MQLCDHSEESFGALISEIMAQGFDEETAGHYAVLIGDTPESDDAGNIIVREDDGRELARLRLKSFHDGKYELAVYRGETLIEEWTADISLDFALEGGTVQMPYWTIPPAIERIEHQTEWSKDGKSFVERTIVHIV